MSVFQHVERLYAVILLNIHVSISSVILLWVSFCVLAFGYFKIIILSVLEDSIAIISSSRLLNLSFVSYGGSPKIFVLTKPWLIMLIVWFIVSVLGSIPPPLVSG